jgi:hypothetical protein
VKRVLILHSKNVAPVAEQIAAAVRHGFRRRDLEADYGSESVYVDKRQAGQSLGYWSDQFVEHATKGDLLHVWDLLIFGPTERAIRERVEPILAKDVSICLMSTGAIIKPSADLDRYFAQLRAAFDVVGRRKANRMNVARRKRGSKTGPKPRFTEADYAKALPVWLSAKTQPEFVLGVEKALGRTMSYSQAFRRAAGFPDKDGNRAATYE